MKTRILLAGALSLSSIFSFAQTEKGDLQIGGGLGLAHQKTDDIPQVSSAQKYTSISVSPSIGRFYANNKLAGIFLNFNYYETLYNSKNIDRVFGGGFFIRQYQPIFKSLYLLFDERARFSYNNGIDILYTQTGQEFPSRYHGVSAGLSAQAGLAYDLTKRIQLETLMNNLLYASFAHYNTGNNYYINSSLDGNTFGNILFGFRYNLQ